MWRFALVILVVLAGCDRSDLKDQSLLTELRVLAVVLDTPEVSPGAVVNVTPFVSDVNGGGRALTYSAEGCVDPGLAVGADFTCVGRPDRVTLATDQPLPLAGPNYTGNAPTFAVTVPNTILDNRGPIVANNGYAYLVFYTVKAPNGANVRVLKRIFASTRTVKNTNPAITGATADGNPLGALPTTTTALKLTLTAGSKESYTFLDSNGQSVAKTEDLLVSWFVTDGELDPIQEDSDEAIDWGPPGAAPTGRNIVLVAVVRDRRGGDAVFSYAFP